MVTSTKKPSRSAPKKPRASAATAKSRQGASSKAAEAKAPGVNSLTPTETPGVFRNASGILVNEAGVFIGLLAARKAEAEDLGVVLDGDTVDSPAKLLKAVALDPRLPLETRMDAANKAAPYFDRKQPIGVDGGVDPNGVAKPIALDVTAKAVAGLSDEELSALRRALAKMKADEGGAA